ncbi:MAG: NTP/NDP exchange transporter, partial [bacterium]
IWIKCQHDVLNIYGVKMQDKNSKGALERLLSLFAEVRAGEGVTALMLTLNLFLVLMSYYIAKVVREALILAEGSAELKSYLSAGQVVLLLGAVRLYAWLASKFSRKRLINSVNIFFSACLGLFYVLTQLQVPLSVIFFLWVGMFNVMVVAQFWSFANDIYTPEAGKRLFAIVAFGASSGAVAGSYLPSLFIPLVGINQLLLLSGGVLLLSLVLTNYVDAREKVGEKVNQTVPKVQAEQPVGKEGAFKLLFNNNYLLMIAFLILLLNWVNTTGEYILGRTVKETADQIALQGSVANFSAKEFIGKFYADFFTVVNIAGMLIQLFLVSRIFKYFGIRVAILFLPLIAFGGYLLLAYYPILNFVRWAKTAENSTDYSLNNTVRHALFLPTTRAEKYKAKQAVDSFFHRSGDVLSAVLVFVGVHWFLFETRHFALVNLGLVAIWLFLAVRIGLENKRLVIQRSQAEGSARSEAGT